MKVRIDTGNGEEVQDLPTPICYMIYNPAHDGFLCVVERYNDGGAIHICWADFDGDKLFFPDAHEFLVEFYYPTSKLQAGWYDGGIREEYTRESIQQWMFVPIISEELPSDGKGHDPRWDEAFSVKEFLLTTSRFL